ncbi:hypothetical protein, partial [Acetobacter cibinongensis]|uniref:hypothetical protein n=1 Tax=Acetobacter cibinongensis TaxID=146475 RepID=UPI00196AFD5B
MPINIEDKAGIDLELSELCHFLRQIRDLSRLAGSPMKVPAIALRLAWSPSQANARAFSVLIESLGIPKMV